MKKQLLFFFSVIAGSLVLFAYVMYPGGSPGGYSGSPGDNGVSCTQCHSGTPQAAISWITADIPPEGYVAGQTYTITATGTHSGVVKFGFEATAEDLAGTKTGNLIITDASQTKLVNSNQAVTHTFSGTTPSGNTKSWSFDWTAPAEGTGTVTFYGSFNAANGNGSTSGDVVYLSSSAFPENTGVGINEDLAEVADMKIFPNPAVNYTTITWNKDLLSIQAVRVYNLAGSLLTEYPVSDATGGRLRLSTEGLQQGMYLVSAHSDEDGIVTASFVKR